MRWMLLASGLGISLAGLAAAETLERLAIGCPLNLPTAAA